MSLGRSVRSQDGGAFLFRSFGLFVFWLVLTGGSAKDIAPGIIAAQSILAGIYVARCALDPRLPIRPGTFAYKPVLGEGPARDAFLTWSSLQPGTLPSGPDEADGVTVHCLDMRAPVAAQFAAEERRFARALAVVK
jgi:multicomponent Na+:H+ antiporter subunit E